MELSVCVTDDEYEAWRAVRLAVEPESRTHSLEELRAQDSSDRLLLLAVEDGDVVGSGIADRAETAGAGFVAPRVLPEHRRLGVGSLTGISREGKRRHIDPNIRREPRTVVTPLRLGNTGARRRSQKPTPEPEATVRIVPAAHV